MISSEDQARDWLLGLPECDAAAFSRLEQLVSLLTAENQRQNLVSAASLAAVWQRHIADSAQLLPLAQGTSLSPWLDLGSGAGFPGLVIAALQPEWHVILVESRALRAQWLEQARLALGLPHVRVVSTRLETLADAAIPEGDNHPRGCAFFSPVTRRRGGPRPVYAPVTCRTWQCPTYQTRQ